MNIKHILYTLLFAFGVTFVGSAQVVVTKKDLDKKSLKLYQEAISLGRKKKFEKSLKTYNKLLKRSPTFVDGYLKKSGMLYNLGRLPASIEAIEEAISIAPEYNPDMYFTKAVVHKELKQYEEAALGFGMYLDRVDSGKRLEKAKTYYAQTSFAAAAIKNPVPYTPVKLEGKINTGNSEYIPALTVDGEQMIFTRRVNGQEDLYIAEKVDGKFEIVEAITDLNTPQNDGVHTISADGRRIIYTACHRRTEGMGSCDLFTAYIKNDGNWSIGRNMGPVINTPAWEAQPSLSSDGYNLFWSTNRKYGQGGNDIWTSTRTDTSGWTEPTPLGTNVNTIHNEESPFIHPDGKTLYFRSNRPVGMGGYDVYYSRFNDTTKVWGPAINIGYPINTEESEGAMSVSLDGKTAYFATDQNTGQDGTIKNLNIYTFDLYEEARPNPVTYVKTKIKDAVSGEPLAANIEIVKLGTTEDPKMVKTTANGTYLGAIVSGYNYGYFVSVPGYIYHSENIKLDSIKGVLDPYILTIEMTKTPVKEVVVDSKPVEATPIILKNIFFETGSADLTLSSDVEIQMLAETLRNSPTMRIEISGHTDNVGSDTDNLLLSEKRAKSVVNSLISKGVNRSQLTYKGYGETVPIDTNDTPEGRQNNRRTEFKIL